jgi:hypothetical protein
MLLVAMLAAFTAALPAQAATTKVRPKHSSRVTAGAVATTGTAETTAAPKSKSAKKESSSAKKSGTTKKSGKKSTTAAHRKPSTKPR